MAVKYAARWRPQAYRSTTEAVNVPGPPTARVMVLQLIVFDDTQVGTAGNPYVPGSPATEQFLAIVDETPIQLAVSAFAGLTNVQSRTLWDNARNAQVTFWQNDPETVQKVNATIGGYLSQYVVIG